VDLWVFDNDGTLYDDRVTQRTFMAILSRYVTEQFNIAPNQIAAHLTSLRAKWETELSVVALAREYDLNFADVVTSTYLQLDLSQCGVTTPDLAKRAVLQSISSPKVVLTNNPSAFARRVLRFVGLEDCFVDIVGIEEVGFLGKPHGGAYRQVVERLQTKFDRIILCDDSLKNLDAARQLGWFTIHSSATNPVPINTFGHLAVSAFEELGTLVQ
jgi:putative hydrolase of the HAD superfamily